MSVTENTRAHLYTIGENALMQGGFLHHHAQILHPRRSSRLLENSWSVILRARRFCVIEGSAFFTTSANSRSFAPPPQQRQRRPLPGIPASLRMTPSESSF